jgi:hypothetical protein
MKNDLTEIPFIVVRIFVCVSLLVVSRDLGKDAWVAYIGSLGWGTYAFNSIARILKD